MLFINLTLNIYHYKGYSLHLVLRRQVSYTILIFLIHLYLEYQKTTFRTDTKEAQTSIQEVKYHRKTTFKKNVSNKFSCKNNFRAVHRISVFSTYVQYLSSIKMKNFDSC